MSKTSIPTAALLVIGNEILSGRTRDANIYSAATKLADHGIDLMEVRVVGDIKGDIIDALNPLRARYDYVFTSGGIGPTHDDITAICVAKAFGAPLEENAEIVKILPKPEHRKMCMVPKGAGLITNDLTCAPGFIIENVYVMAGVPSIMSAMMDGALRDIPKASRVISKTVESTRPESALAQDLSKIQDAHTDVEIGSYPHFDADKKRSRGVQLVIRGRDEGAVNAAREEVQKIA